MAYDDDSSFGRFRDLEDMATVLDRFLSTPENLTIGRLISLTDVLHRWRDKNDFQELAKLLKERGLAGVPFNTVIAIHEATSEIDADEDVLAHITLRQAQRFITR
jgi:hypothetical protein